MDAIETAIRHIAIGQLLVMGLVFLRDSATRRGGRLAIATIVAIICYIYDLGLGERRSVFDHILVMGGLMGTPLIWLFTLTLFQDDFKLKGWHWAIAAILPLRYILRILLGLSIDDPLAQILLAGAKLIQISLLAQAVFVVLVYRKTDLVEARRSLRGWVAGGVSGYILLRVSMEFAGLAGWLDRTLPLFHPGIILILSTWINVSLLRLRSGQLLVKVPSAPAHTPPPVNLSLAKKIQPLLAEMDAGAYRVPDLTISALAERIGLQ